MPGSLELIDKLHPRRTSNLSSKSKRVPFSLGIKSVASFIVLLVFGSISIFRLDQNENTPTTTVYKQNTNVMRELCSSSFEKCSIQKKPKTCNPQFSNKLKQMQMSGQIFTIPESNMTSANLTKFCQNVKRSSGIRTILRPSLSSLSAFEVTAMDCERTIPGNISGVHKFSAGSSGRKQKQSPLIAFPAYSKSNPEDFKHSKAMIWREYTTGFVSIHQDMCFWPEVPQKTRRSSSNKQQQLSILTKKDPIYTNKLLVSGGLLKNFWHSMLILNSWCTMKDDPDISFLVQEEGKIPSFVINFANAIGINSTRILLHDRPVVSNSDIYAAPFCMGAVDWSCLQDSLQVKVEEDKLSYALLYFRPDAKKRPDRDIPLGLHKKFAKVLSKELGIPVKTFNGEESFEGQRELFSRAKIFIGPHGAGFSNLVFTSNPIPVVELLTPKLFRSWQMFGAHSFRRPLPWWPVLVKSFSDDEAILGQAVSVAKKAYLYHYHQGRDDELMTGKM